MTQVQKIERWAKETTTRVQKLVKVGSAVVTAGVGSGVAVRTFLFENWHLVAPVAEGSVFGMFAVATLAALAAFLMSVWTCAVANCVTTVVSVLSPKKKTCLRKANRPSSCTRRGQR